jgi:translation initiation factor eIF-2B subunit delta
MSEKSDKGESPKLREPTSNVSEGLSAKDLKAQKKAEKQARREAAKQVAGKPAQGDPRKAEGGQQRQGSGQVQGQVHGHHPTANATPIGGEFHHPQSLFGHLEKSGRNLNTSPSKDVHPAVVMLGIQYANYKIIGSTERCHRMLVAFKQVISDYNTPAGTSLSRNLTNHLSHQIDYLKSARPLSISMGNSIRWLKHQITNVSIDLTDSEAKAYLNSLIDNFIRDRIELAGQVIVESAVEAINDGDVILTYASSSVVKQSLIEAHKRGKKFRVIVVDSRPLFEGKRMARELMKAGLNITYILLGSVCYVMKSVTTVFTGAHAMFSNGLLYSRVGTALITNAAKVRGIPVLVLCETIKFSDRVQLDSVTVNELAPLDQLTNISIDPDKSVVKSPVADSHEDIPTLSMLNVLYDLSGGGAIKKVITELGSLPASSVPVILREYKLA